MCQHLPPQASRETHLSRPQELLPGDVLHEEHLHVAVEHLAVGKLGKTSGEGQNMKKKVENMRKPWKEKERGDMLLCVVRGFLDKKLYCTASCRKNKSPARQPPFQHKAKIC